MMLAKRPKGKQPSHDLRFVHDCNSARRCVGSKPAMMNRDEYSDENSDEYIGAKE